MSKTFLLVGNPQELSFKNRLEKILGPYGKIQMVSSQQKKVPTSEIVIIDATEEPDFIDLVERYHKKDPKARIIVATAVPTWQRARQAFQSGAYKYVEKNMSDQDLFKFFTIILNAA